jgi:hypothetical protein
VIWYIENPSRSRSEREAIESLASGAAWLVPGEWRIDSSLRLIWDADILVGERSFPVSLRYPNHFPHSPPLVLPRGEAERWSSHQYGAGGELCLEYGPDNWHQNIPGAVMIESAYRLLQGERPAPGQRGQVASRHATTLGQDLRGHGMRLLVTPGLAAVMDGVQEGELREGNAVGTFRDSSVVYVVESIVAPGGEKWTDDSIPRAIVDEGVERPMALLRWSADAKLPAVKSLTEFRAALAARGAELPDVNYVLLARGKRLHAYFLWKNDDSACAITIIPPEAAARRLDEAHALLPARKVALVGCGSLGSKIAVMLARSGVGKFLLVDDDVMLPHNLVRHDLDWREIGRHKVDGVARRITLVNPAAQCDARSYRLGGQQSSGSIETLIKSLAQCDLIINSSADPRVFTYLCAAVAVGKKTLLWAEVFGGGFGGLVARYRPGLEPDPATMRAKIEQWCLDQGKPVPRAAIPYETRGSGPPLIADDADVTVIAAHAARLAIDTLIARDPSLFPYSVYMIGMAKGWVFEEPFETRPIDVGPPGPEPEIVIDPQIAEEELARVLDMLKKFADENPASAADRTTPGE